MKTKIREFLRMIVPGADTRIAQRPKTAPVLCALSLLGPMFASAQSIETVIEAPGPHGALKGVLLQPAHESSTAAIIIPGSGPTDHDGNNPLGVQAASYRYLARDLAAAGIATVRIDKRGMYSSAGAIPDPNAVTVADYVTDVQSWADVVRSRLGARCVWLIGHSEGALVALAAAQQPARYCGVISIAGAGLPMGQLLRRQIRANPANAPLLNEAMSAIAELEAGRHVDPSILHPALQPIFHPKTQGFLIDLFSYDPQTLIGKSALPVLILQGERDLQVTVDDARRLKAGRPDARLAVLPDTNHVLKRIVSDDPGANLATYADPGLPLAPGIVEAISTFIKGSRR